MKNETGFYPKVHNHSLSPIEKRVLLIRQKYPDMTYAVIGWNTGVTRQRVEQILNRYKRLSQSVMRLEEGE